MSTIPLKPGTTLEIPGSYARGSLSGVSLTSDAMRGNERISLTCEITDAAAGEYMVSLTPAETATMSIGLWETDVRFVDAVGRVIQTYTYYLDVQEGITGGG